MQPHPILVPAILVGLCTWPIACGSDNNSGVRANGNGGTGGEQAIALGNAGIGGNGTPQTAGTGEQPSDPIENYCLVQCQTRLRCGSLNLAETSLQKCTSNCKHPYGDPTFYREEVFAAMSGCFTKLDCGRSMDECNIVGANVVSSDPENFPVTALCLTQFDACSDGASPFSDDICLVGMFLVESAYPAFEACMAKPCAEVPSCFNAIRGRPSG